MLKYLKTKIFPIKFKGFYYVFQPITGSLICKKANKSINSTLLEHKLNSVVALNNKPYTLAINNTFKQNTLNKASVINIHAKMLTAIAKYSFKLAQYFSCLLPKYFENASDAICYYRKNIYPNKQNELCLARALFAAASSKGFKQNGVIFIGVFLPSNTMHAWVIVNGKIADPDDGVWLNYQPVAALYYE